MKTTSHVRPFVFCIPMILLSTIIVHAQRQVTIASDPLIHQLQFAAEEIKAALQNSVPIKPHLYNHRI